MSHVARSVSSFARYRPAVSDPTEPFRSAEEAWFWTMRALAARREGARSVAHAGGVKRPCEPDDVVKCLDDLYRRGRIDLTQARLLRLWGERGLAPDARCGAAASAWRAAMASLAWPLRLKGIVVSA